MCDQKPLPARPNPGLQRPPFFRFSNGAFFFEPDLQYIIRPGGTGNIPNAFVVGAQVGINF